ERPSLASISGLRDLAGNEQFVAVHAERDKLLANYKQWSATSDTIQQRLRPWQRLETLLKYAVGLPITNGVARQVDAIRANRGLLDTPDPVPPLAAELSAALREALRTAQDRLSKTRDSEVSRFEASEEWVNLDPKERGRLI